MKIIVFSLSYNCADIIPWFLRHYDQFADEISIWDDGSTDGTREILKSNPKVILRDWPHEPGINEDIFLAHWQEWYPKARGHFDWVMIPDTDELLWCENMRPLLEMQQKTGVEVIKTQGFNMVGDGLPKDDGRQLWSINPMGVRAPVYSKPVVFQPHIKINWNRGKHALENCNPVISHLPYIKLLHFRYLGYAYTAAKNAKNYARCGLTNGDKAAAWSCSPNYNGRDKEHSPLWSERAKEEAFNVLKV